MWTNVESVQVLNLFCLSLLSTASTYILERWFHCVFLTFPKPPSGLKSHIKCNPYLNSDTWTVNLHRNHSKSSWKSSHHKGIRRRTRKYEFTWKLNILNSKDPRAQNPEDSKSKRCKDEKTQNIAKWQCRQCMIWIDLIWLWRLWLTFRWLNPTAIWSFARRTDRWKFHKNRSPRCSFNVDLSKGADTEIAHCSCSSRCNGEWTCMKVDERARCSKSPFSRLTSLNFTGSRTSSWRSGQNSKSLWRLWPLLTLLT